MALKFVVPLITKVGFAHKLGPTSEWHQIFNLESIKTNENLYNDPFYITRKDLGWNELKYIGSKELMIFFIFKLKYLNKIYI